MGSGSQKKIRGYWWQSDTLKGMNAGDVSAAVILNTFSGKLPHNSMKGYFRYLTVGSVLHKARFGDILWGIGARGQHMQKLPRFLRIHAVRGPLTAMVLKHHGYSVPEVFGDPGFFIPEILGVSADPKGQIGVVPHFKDFSIAERKIQDSSVKLIDILSGLRVVVQEIARCSLIYSSSLHGLVFSEAMGIPALYVQFENDESVLGPEGRSKFKFDDYYLGTERDPQTPLDWTQDIVYSEAAPAMPHYDVSKLMSSCPFNVRGLKELKDLAAYNERDTRYDQ